MYTCTTALNNNMCNMGISKRTAIPIIEVSKPTYGQVLLTGGNSSIVTLWFDRDGMPMVLIDDNYLSDSEESDDDYEYDFAVCES